MLNSVRYIVIFSIFFLSGCDIEKAKVLDDNFTNTKIGTIQDKKLVKVIEKKKKEPKPEITPKQDLKKYSAYKKQNNKTLNKKDKFVEILAPVVVSVYNKLQNKYEAVKIDIENNKNTDEIEKLKKEYKAKNNIELLHAIKPHPISIVLAQSAIESAWLTSRFAKEANNIFGVWSFKKDEPRIAASGLRGDKTIYLKKYNSFQESVEDYYKSVAKSWAYKELRYMRTQTNNPDILLPYFRMYSEKRDEYVAVLKKVLDYNKFDRFDVKD
ncbi:MAG: glucosaminidase domain-containing protein [Campylobacterota bacterium]|nr:glucosaminidase domain-containing protein [Campylobacterota bacterium]